MLQEISFLEYFRWDVISLSVLGIFFMVNVVVAFNYQKKLQILQLTQANSDKHLLELAGDVKALYESGTTLGSKLKSLEFGSKMLKEEQEKLSLKDPGQQMYRNAVQQINNGESINKISESSGLSRGEIELLKLFQKIDNETHSPSMEKAVASR